MCVCGEGGGGYYEKGTKITKCAGLGGICPLHMHTVARCPSRLVYDTYTVPHRFSMQLQVGKGKDTACGASVENSMYMSLWYEP